MHPGQQRLPAVLVLHHPREPLQSHRTLLDTLANDSNRGRQVAFQLHAVLEAVADTPGQLRGQARLAQGGDEFGEIRGRQRHCLLGPDSLQPGRNPGQPAVNGLSASFVVGYIAQAALQRGPEPLGQAPLTAQQALHLVQGRGFPRSKGSIGQPLEGPALLPQQPREPGHQLIGRQRYRRAVRQVLEKESTTPSLHSPPRLGDGLLGHTSPLHPGCQFPPLHLPKAQQQLHGKRGSFPASNGLEGVVGRSRRVENHQHLSGPFCQGLLHGRDEGVHPFAIIEHRLQKLHRHIPALGAAVEGLRLAQSTQLLRRRGGQDVQARPSVQPLAQESDASHQVLEVAQHQPAEQMRLIQHELIHQGQTVDQQTAVFDVLTEEPVNLIRRGQDQRFVQSSDELAARHATLKLSHLQAGDLSQGVHHLALVLQQGHRGVHQEYPLDESLCQLPNERHADG